MRIALVVFFSSFLSAILALLIARSFVQMVDGKGAKTAADRITGLIYWLCAAYLFAFVGVMGGLLIERVLH